MCLRMYETKLHCPRRNTFCLELLLRKASLSQWKRLLDICRREACIIQRLLAKICHPGHWFFPRYIRHIARQIKKKPGLWHLQGGCNYELLLRKAVAVADT